MDILGPFPKFVGKKDNDRKVRGNREDLVHQIHRLDERLVRPECLGREQDQR